MIFAESDHSRAMREYEQACCEAHASDPDARKIKRKSLEDELVEGGMEAVNSYRATLSKRWEKASCLAEHDGLSIGFSIAQRAEARINTAEGSP